MGKNENMGLSYLVYAKCSEGHCGLYTPESRLCRMHNQSQKRRENRWESAYWYCDLCDGIEYYVTLEQEKGRIEHTGCSGHWGMEQMAKNLKDLGKYLESIRWDERIAWQRWNNQGKENIGEVIPKWISIPLEYGDEDEKCINEGMNTSYTW